MSLGLTCVSAVFSSLLPNEEGRRGILQKRRKNKHEKARIGLWVNSDTGVQLQAQTHWPFTIRDL